MDCKRCNGIGYLSIMRDDDRPCPECLGSGEDIVAHYSHLYKYPYMLRWILKADQRALESARDDYWYICGLYDALGYDRAGRSYTQYIETDAELNQVLEDQIVKEEQKYGH